MTTVVALCALATAACGENLGTSVEIELRYDDALGLDTAEVILAGTTQTGPIAHRLMLLVPDALAPMPIEVWGRKGDQRAAYGTGSVVPVLGKTATATVSLTACTPGCQGGVLTSCTGPQISCDHGCSPSGEARCADCNATCEAAVLTSCTAPPVTCEYGCSASGEARCVTLQLANGIEASDASGLTGTTVIELDTTFDTDTGEITGGLVRAPGVGDGGASGVGYLQRLPLEAGGAPLGVFVVSNLTILRDVVVQFTGRRAAVILVGDTARIAGTIDVSGGRGERSTPGPGGGAGGSTGVPARGCGPGGPGGKSMTLDSGGGGGGGGGIGGRGGTASNPMQSPSIVPGGEPGAVCLAGAPQVRQLLGGSGGGAGSPGMAPTPVPGGGGGGAIQISALGHIEVTGLIQAGGAGGDGGPKQMVDAGAGAGGGAGGAIVLEAPAVMIAGTGIVAANGGGGGGGGSTSAVGAAGTDGQASAVPAPGGFNSIAGAGAGGDGGAGTTAATAGTVTTTTNANGGGGAVGTITIRAGMRMKLGTISPPAVELDLEFTR